MTINSDSYGSVTQVAALVKRWTNSGSFDTTTQPTLAEVEQFINDISATINIALAGSGFTVPVTNTTAKAALAAIVVEYAAELCNVANSSGRFFTDRAVERGINPNMAIRRELQIWVTDNAPGLENSGAARGGQTGLGTIAYRGTDESGADVSPLFQRKAFGNSDRNWDN